MAKFHVKKRASGTTEITYTEIKVSKRVDICMSVKMLKSTSEKTFQLYIELFIPR